MNTSNNKGDIRLFSVPLGKTVDMAEYCFKFGIRATDYKTTLVLGCFGSGKSSFLKTVAIGAKEKYTQSELGIWVFDPLDGIGSQFADRYNCKYYGYGTHAALWKDLRSEIQLRLRRAMTVGWRGWYPYDKLLVLIDDYECSIKDVDSDILRYMFKYGPAAGISIVAAGQGCFELQSLAPDLVPEIDQFYILPFCGSLGSALPRKLGRYDPVRLADMEKELQTGQCIHLDPSSGEFQQIVDIAVQE